MKAVIAAVVMFASLVLAGPAHAWNCSDPLAARVPVSAGTTGSFGNGDGQLFLGTGSEGVKGQLYECEPPTTPPTTPSNTVSATSNSTANASSASNSTSSAKADQSQQQGQTAQGGNASATGGSVSNSGNSSSKSSVSNSGNSSNKNVNTATGGNQSQSSTSSANGNGVGNGNNSNDSITNIKEPNQVATAIAGTVLPTVPCFKGVGAGVQTGMFGASFGGGKIDANCAALEASRLAPSLVARCKVYITNKYVKAAGVSLADCLNIPQPPPVTVIAPAPLPPAPVINLSIPAPVVAVIPAPVVAASPSVAVAAAQTHHKKHVPCTPESVPQGKGKCVVTNESLTK